jgi:adenine phosphoribosyltransferase
VQYYTLKLLGLTRKLPLVYVGKRTQLANLTLLGDVELVDKLADILTEKIKSLHFDYLVAPEIKIVPLVHGVAKRLGHKRFVVCRKTVKPYMVNPVILKPLSHFPKHVRPLVMSGEDAKFLKEKRVVLMDDVVSTGVTMRMLTKLMEKIVAHVVLRVAVLKQGEQFEPIDNLITLGELPIFKEK